jgi:hypothetical protein
VVSLNIKDIIQLEIDAQDFAFQIPHLISIEDASQPSQKYLEAIEMNSKHYTGRPEIPPSGNWDIDHFGEIGGVRVTEIENIDNIDRIDTSGTRPESFLVQYSSEPPDIVFHRGRWLGLIQLVLMNAIISWTVRY